MNNLKQIIIESLKIASITHDADYGHFTVRYTIGSQDYCLVINTIDKWMLYTKGWAFNPDSVSITAHDALSVEVVLEIMQTKLSNLKAA